MSGFWWKLTWQVLWSQDLAQCPSFLCSWLPQVYQCYSAKVGLILIKLWVGNIFAFFVSLDLEDFDIVDGIAMDAMHLMHLSITKKLWKLLGSPANVFPRQKTRQISLQWHQLFIYRKVTLEMRHKTSDLPVTNTFKASDWQLLITLAFDDMAINFNGLWSWHVQCDRKRMQQIFKLKILSFFFGKSYWNFACKYLWYSSLYI